MSQNYPPVVIVGLNDAALSIVRSLGRKGIRIIGLYDGNSPSYYIKSKYCSVRLQAPLSGEPLLDALINNVAKDLKEQAVLFCTNDNTVLSVSKYQDELKPFFKFVLPSYDVTSTQISKKGFHKFAIDNSFLVPKTFFANGVAEVEEIINGIAFPCIIKPEFRDRIWSGKVPVKVLYAQTEQEFLNLIKKYEIERIPLVIQEWIDGDDTEVYFCLTYISRNNGPLALCTGRKLRQHPHLTGSTSIAETIWNPEIATESIRLLTKAGCIGFCSVEYKRSNKNYQFYVTEPTVGRPDTQEGVCIGAGLDIPWIAYLDAIEQGSKPVGEFKIGIKWINEPLEFYCFQEHLRNGVDLKGFASIYKGVRSYALWSFEDPLPALTFIKDKAVKGINKMRREFSGIRETN
jgi:D-aspartate ligase